MVWPAVVLVTLVLVLLAHSQIAKRCCLVSQPQILEPAAHNVGDNRDQLNHNQKLHVHVSDDSQYDMSSPSQTRSHLATPPSHNGYSPLEDQPVTVSVRFDVHIIF